MAVSVLLVVPVVVPVVMPLLWVEVEELEDMEVKVVELLDVVTAVAVIVEVNDSRSGILMVLMVMVEAALILVSAMMVQLLFLVEEEEATLRVVSGLSCCCYCSCGGCDNSRIRSCNLVVTAVSAVVTAVMVANVLTGPRPGTAFATQSATCYSRQCLKVLLSGKVRCFDDLSKLQYVYKIYK